MSSSKIEWTDKVWNPLTGCTKISPGCDHCYADRFANRRLTDKYRNGFDLTLHPDELGKPLAWKKPRLIFVNSMSDLFHGNVPLEFIQQTFDVMKHASWHRFQILTKRADRLRRLAPDLEWPPNVWMGVSVETAGYQHRIWDLQKVPAAVRFLSIEPLLGPISKLALDGIHWVIVGGESGPGARPMDPAWVREIRDQCVAAGVPFFFKQWGEFNQLGEKVGKHQAGRMLDGRTWDERPTVMEVC